MFKVVYLIKGELANINASLPTKADAKDLKAFVRHERVDEIDRTLIMKGEKEIIHQNHQLVEEKFQVKSIFFMATCFCSNALYV